MPVAHRAASLAFALVLITALAAVTLDRALAPTLRAGPDARVTAALAASLDATRAHQQRALAALAARARPESFARLDAATPTLRSVQLVDARGSVLASRELASSPPRCPARVLTLPAGDGGQRLVAAFDDDCDALRALAALRALRGPARASPLAAALTALAGAALAALVAGRLTAARARRLGVFGAAAGRVGAGDLTARVRPRGDELDALAGAFNQMAEALSLTRERVDYLQRLAGWQDVARRLAHEIKNPLTPIQLAVQEVARRYAGDDAKFKRTLETAREVVEEEVATLRRLVTAFSEFARLPEVKPAPADLAEFVRDMETSRQFLDEAAGEAGKKVTVVFSTDDTPIPVMVDRIMLRRAFENLVRNAAQALGDRGGTVWVRAERRRVAVTPTEGAAPEEVDQAWLVVEDDGPGIASANHAKVFDPYFTTKSEGTGLGLAIVRKIAIDHAGDVGLEDRPGGGARFVITLPLRDPARRQRLSFVTFTRNP
jgi:two-component system nitrogen regulation sensor histidine kinase NtrY